MKPAPANIQEILALHRQWLANDGGARADFRGTDLRGCAFVGADLRKARFQNANLEGTDFSGANLAGTNFCFARLVGTNLKTSGCKDTLFVFANMTNASVDEDCLRDAVLFGANLSGTVPITNFRLWIRANPMLMMASYMLLLIIAMAFGAEVFIRFFL